MQTSKASFNLQTKIKYGSHILQSRRLRSLISWQHGCWPTYGLSRKDLNLCNILIFPQYCKEFCIATNTSSSSLVAGSLSPPGAKNKGFFLACATPPQKLVLWYGIYTRLQVNFVPSYILWEIQSCQIRWNFHSKQVIMYTAVLVIICFETGN